MSIEIEARAQDNMERTVDRIPIEEKYRSGIMGARTEAAQAHNQSKVQDIWGGTGKAACAYEASLQVKECNSKLSKGRSTPTTIAEAINQDADLARETEEDDPGKKAYIMPRLPWNPDP